MYAYRQDGNWVQFSGQLLTLEGGNLYHVPDQWSDAEKEARFGLFLAAEDPVPADNKVVSEALIDDNGRPRLSRTLETRPAVRRGVLKSVVQARIIDAGKMAEAYAALTTNPVYFAKWFAPDHPAVYCDDPDAVGLIQTLGLDPAQVLAP